jgi:hypothetical protein
MNHNLGKSVRKYVPIILAFLVTGCGRAPSFDVAGSVFPAWLFCLAGAVLFTFLSRWLLLHLHFALAPPILVYPSLTAAFAFALWLIFFH